MGDHNVCPSCGGDTMAPARKGCDTPDWSHAQSDGLDLFEPLPTPPPFAVHTITVTKIEYEDPPGATNFGIDPIECEYTIDHGHCDLRGEECIVEGIVNDIGLHQSIFGVWDKDHRLEAQDYRVRGWVSVSPATPNGPEEYDAGIEEVDDDDDDDEM